MSELSWGQAVRALLNAIGVSEPPAIGESFDTLPELLRGSGLLVHRKALINQMIPEMDAQLGCLLELRNGSWFAVIGGGEESLLLAEGGAVARPLTPADLDMVKEALIVCEQVANLAAMVPLIRRHRSRFIEIFLCGLIINFFALCLPLFSSFVYDKILGNGITDTLWALVMGLGIIIIVEFCMRATRVIIAEKFAISSEADIDHAVFRNVLDAHVNTLPGMGSVLEKYKQIISYRDFLSSSYVIAMADVPFILLFLLTITIVAGPLVLVPMLCGGAMLLISSVFTIPVFDYDREARRASERRFALFADLLAGREAVIGSAFRNLLSRRWRQASVSSISASSLARYWRALGQTMLGSISYISYIAVIVGGVYMVETHDITSGGLLAASMLTSRAMASFASVNMLIIRYHEFRTALREMNKIFPANTVSEVQHSHGPLSGHVRFEKVVCRLGHGGHPVLNGVSFYIPAGEMVGIAGMPGAGKTTLLRLLAGLLPPDEGQVLIDNMPLAVLSHLDLSETIGFKPQDLCLFDQTIEENVRAGRAPLTAAQRDMVLEMSGLNRAFHESGLHWGTDIGNRGSNLSGGQRQLVSIARALIHQPPLLLLDEPTNGLDAALEVHLAEQLCKLRGRSTMLISTHSRNLLAACDRIIVVGQGRILADGPTSKVLV